VSPDGCSASGRTYLHESCVQCRKSESVLYFKDAVERIRERAGR
jgi:hypothetical protein